MQTNYSETCLDPGLRRDDVHCFPLGLQKHSVTPANAGVQTRMTWGAVAFAAILSMLPSAALASEGIGGAVDPSIYRLMVFVMAIFVGYYVVWSVTPALHTPLMSVTNAISSVIVVGALLAVGVELVMEGTTLARVFGFLALVMASVNIFGGFLVTQRMLAMYKKKDKAGK